MFCEKCGATNIDEAKFCGQCGHPLTAIKKQEIKTEETKIETRKLNKKKNPLLWGSIIIVVIAIVVAGVIMLKGLTEKNQYSDLMAQGQKYYEEMDYEAAIAAYEEAISIDPKQADGYIKLAETHAANGDPKKAEETLNDGENNVTGKDKDKIIKKREEIKGYIAYSWVVEATIEADNIYYEKEAFDEVSNDEYKQWMMEYAIIEKDGKFGLIDMFGHMLGGLDYKAAHGYYDTLLLDRIEPQYEAVFDMEWSLYGLIDGEIQMVEGLGGGLPGNTYYYALDTLHNILDAYGEEPGFFWNYSSEPYNSIPVLGFAQVLLDSESDKLLPFYDKSYRYGIYSDGKMVTPFEYEQCGSLSDGLFAAMKDGKWGYINEAGEVVIPFEYDASWDRFRIYNEGYEFFDYAYSATDGFVVLNRDGKWSLCNTAGKTVIPEGRFEKICPVYDGKCWVKQNGKWGVIEFDIVKKEQPKKKDKDVEVDFEEILLGEVNHPIQKIEIADYDSDGKKEAFAVSGSNPDESGLYSSAQIWFVDSEGNCSLLEEDIYGMFQEKVVAGDHTFFVWEVTALGSSSYSLIFGVKDGKAYEPAISGMFGSFGATDDKYFAIADNWESGYHQYDAVYFEFKETEFIEIGREKNAW